MPAHERNFLVQSLCRLAKAGHKFFWTAVVPTLKKGSVEALKETVFLFLDHAFLTMMVMALDEGVGIKAYRRTFTGMGLAYGLFCLPQLHWIRNIFESAFIGAFQRRFLRNAMLLLASGLIESTVFSMLWGEGFAPLMMVNKAIKSTSGVVDLLARYWQLYKQPIVDVGTYAQGWLDGSITSLLPAHMLLRDVAEDAWGGGLAASVTSEALKNNIFKTAGGYSGLYTALSPYLGSDASTSASGELHGRTCVLAMMSIAFHDNEVMSKLAAIYLHAGDNAKMAQADKVTPPNHAGMTLVPKLVDLLLEFRARYYKYQKEGSDNGGFAVFCHKLKKLLGGAGAASYLDLARGSASFNDAAYQNITDIKDEHLMSVIQGTHVSLLFLLKENSQNPSVEYSKNAGWMLGNLSTAFMDKLGVIAPAHFHNETQKQLIDPAVVEEIIRKFMMNEMNSTTMNELIEFLTTAQINHMNITNETLANFTTSYTLSNFSAVALDYNIKAAPALLPDDIRFTVMAVVSAFAMFSVRWSSKMSGTTFSAWGVMIYGVILNFLAENYMQKLYTMANKGIFFFSGQYSYFEWTWKQVSSFVWDTYYSNMNPLKWLFDLTDVEVPEFPGVGNTIQVGWKLLLQFLNTIGMTSSWTGAFTWAGVLSMIISLYTLQQVKSGRIGVGLLTPITGPLLFSWDFIKASIDALFHLNHRLGNEDAIDKEELKEQKAAYWDQVQEKTKKWE